MQANCSRRDWLIKTVSGIAGVSVAAPGAIRAATAPASPVAVGKCRGYDTDELLPALEIMFEQIGGLGRIVKGKTVALKINLTGAPSYRLGYLPLGDTHYANPSVIAAATYLMAKAGARRIRVLESPWSSADGLEETMLQAN